MCIFWLILIVNLGRCWIVQNGRTKGIKCIFHIISFVYATLKVHPIRIFCKNNVLILRLFFAAILFRIVAHFYFVTMLLEFILKVFHCKTTNKSIVSTQKYKIWVFQQSKIPWPEMCFFFSVFYDPVWKNVYWSLCTNTYIACIVVAQNLS